MINNKDDPIMQHNLVTTLTIPHDANTKTRLKQLNGVKILHMNIRSVKKNLDEFMTMLQSFEVEIPIIVLTEAQLHADLPIYSIPTYECQGAMGNLTRNEGVLIYYKTDWDAEVIPNTITDCNSLLIKLKNKDKEVNVLGVYRSPSVNNVIPFVDSLEETLKNHRKLGIVVVGDVNINLKYPNTQSDKTDYYLNMTSSCGYISCINNETRVTDRSSSIIDHIFIHGNMYHEDITALVIETSVTDHYTEVINLPTVITKKEHQHRKPMQKINYTQLNVKLQEERWTNVYNEGDTNRAYDTFLKTFKEHIDECSEQIVRNPARTTKIKPWMTMELVEEIRHRDKIMKKAKTSSNETFKEYCRTFATNVKAKLFAIKNSYFKEQLREAGNDMKKTWKIINNVTNNGQTSKPISSIVYQDKEFTVKENADIVAKLFNEHYLTTGVKLAQQFEENEDSHRTYINGLIRNPHSIYLRPCTSAEIQKHIGKLKNTHSTGHDGINSLCIKNTAEFITRPITYLANLMMETGTFPDNLKKATVIPCFKSGNRKELNNYRPISLITTLAKIFERVICDRVEGFVNQHKILSDRQFGFKKNTGTNDALSEVVNEINLAKDKGHFTTLLMLDLQKCFDTIPHNYLLKKLEILGIRGLGGKLLKSYITGRTQRAKINEISSSEGLITIGLPQGSIMAPILFKLYINDIFQLKLYGKLTTFADDTSSTNSAPNREQLYREANSDFNQIRDWLQINQLSLNVQKTTYLEIKKKKPVVSGNDDHKIKDIQKAKSAKYLGIVIDEKMSWEEHITLLTQKIRKTYYKFLQLRQSADKEILRMTYFAIVQSHLQYGILAWGGATQNVMEKLNVAHRRVLKIILKKPKLFPTVELFQLAQVLTVNQIYLKEAVTLIHKHRNSLQNVTHQHETRFISTQPLIQNRPKTTYIQRQANYQGIKFYNNLEREIKLIANLPTFRRKIHNILLPPQ